MRSLVLWLAGVGLGVSLSVIVLTARYHLVRRLTSDDPNDPALPYILWAAQADKADG